LKAKLIHWAVIAIRVGLGVLFVYAGIAKFKPKEEAKPAQAAVQPQALPQPAVAPAVAPAATQTTATLQTVASVQQEAELPEHVVKIKALIGGMKQTGYFWSLLGIAEILCGLLLLSQALALLGAVMLVPVNLNVFLFHVYLEPHETGEMIMTGLYLLGNLVLLAYHWPALKSTFLPNSKILKPS